MDNLNALLMKYPWRFPRKCMLYRPSKNCKCKVLMRYHSEEQLLDNDLHTLLWGHNGRDGVSDHQSYDCLLNRLFRCRPKKTSKLRITGLCEGNSPVTGEFPAQGASHAENVFIWWCHHDMAALIYVINQMAFCVTNIKTTRKTFFL